MNSLTVTVETDDPICPKAECIVSPNREMVFIRYAIVGAIHCRTKPSVRGLKSRYVVDIDPIIAFYSVLECDRQILATLSRIKERALTQLENQKQ
jgi:hypothetical protein